MTYILDLNIKCLNDLKRVPSPPITTAKSASELFSTESTSIFLLQKYSTLSVYISFAIFFSKL